MVAALGAEPDAMVVAFDKATGAEAWRALDTNSEAGYSSPIVITAGGVRQLIVWDPAGVTSLDQATGRIWWEHDFPIASGLTIGTPVRSGATCSSRRWRTGADAGAQPRPSGGAGGLDRHQPQPHRPPRAAIHDVDAHRVGRRDLRAQQLRRAARRGRDDRRAAVVERPPRARDRWASSHLVQHQDRSFISVETGELVIARFTPAGYEEVDRTHLLTPTTRTRGGGSNRWRNVDRAVLWAHSTFANGHVIARNDAEVVRMSLTAADYE